MKRYLTEIKWDSYLATSVAEGFADFEPSEDEIHDAWQYLVDIELVWQLQGWFGRTARELIEAGLIKAKGDDKK